MSSTIKSSRKWTWTKCPSVTRHGKYFYTTKHGDTRYWVKQDWNTNLWAVEDDHGAVWGEFKTARQAINAIETI